MSARVGGETGSDKARVIDGVTVAPQVGHGICVKEYKSETASSCEEGCTVAGTGTRVREGNSKPVDKYVADDEGDAASEGSLDTVRTGW